MRRRYRGKQNQNLTMIVVLLGVAGLLSPVLNSAKASIALKYFSFALISLMLLISCFFLCRWIYIHFTSKQRAAAFASLHAHDVDSMSGKEFEIFLQQLLTSRGYRVKGVYHGNDGGVDLVAKKDKETYSIQAKRYNSRKKADRRAITDAVAGIQYQNCTKAMAITNSYFTKAAIEYARKTDCILIDRDKLALWIYELEN